MAHKKYRIAAGALGAVALLCHPQGAFADAGGLSFWLPGAFGSLAAVPTVPGWAYTTIYLHPQSSAGAGANFVLPGGGRGAVSVGITDHADAHAGARRPGRLYRACRARQRRRWRRRHPDGTARQQHLGCQNR